MAANPNPARITSASWWFAEQLLALAPGTLNGGIYADKPGYHNTRTGNLPTDYSVRELEDQAGPADKAAGYDWTFPDAQAGDYRRMALFGARLRAAFDRRDPRLAGWREALGQTDLDAAPEGLDFRHHITRVPSGSHAWHWHFSEDRGQVGSYHNKIAMLSVLRGETLTQWRGVMATIDDVYRLLHDGLRPEGLAQTAGGGVPIAWIVRQLGELRAGLAAVETRLAAGLLTAEQVAELTYAIREAVAGTDPAAVVAAVKQALTEGTGG